MLKLVSLGVVLAGCAMGTAGPSVPKSPDEAVLIKREPIDPTLPSVDRIEYQVRGKFGWVAKDDVNVCVRPNGTVESVELVGGSALPAFDLAVVDDTSQWKYPAIPGPDNVYSCTPTVVAYHPH